MNESMYFLLIMVPFQCHSLVFRRVSLIPREIWCGLLGMFLGSKIIPPKNKVFKEGKGSYVVVPLLG